MYIGALKDRSGIVVQGIRQWYRRVRFGQPIVIVSGLPRSGTSMTMKMLEAAGLELVTDGVRTADEDNPKGYFELERVKSLTEEPDKSWLKDARGKVVKIISFLLKELPPNHNYDVIFMRRDLSEVLASQSKMLERRGESSQTDDARMRELYENDLWKAVYLLKHTPWFHTLEVRYRDVLDDPREQAKRVAEFLGRPLPIDKMAEVVDARLYRNRA
jgi:hypothetical protein